MGAGMENPDAAGTGAGSRRTTPLAEYLSRLTTLEGTGPLSAKEIFLDEYPGQDADESGHELAARSIREIVQGTLKSLIEDHGLTPSAGAVFSAISYFLMDKETQTGSSPVPTIPVANSVNHFRPDIALLLADLADELKIPIGSPSLWVLALKMADPNTPDLLRLNSQVTNKLLAFEPNQCGIIEITDELREVLAEGITAIGREDLVPKLTALRTAALPLRPPMLDDEDLEH
jgi:hypothetical protein